MSCPKEALRERRVRVDENPFLRTIVLKGGEMRKFLFILSLGILFLPQFAPAAQVSDPNRKEVIDSLPPVILSGLQAYKDKGPEEAVQTWIKDSPIDGSKDALNQANSLHQIQNFYGAYQFFEVISTRGIGRRTRIVYLILDFEKGPVFAKFVVYKSNQRWILTSFDFNTKEEAVFPMPE